MIRIEFDARTPRKTDKCWQFGSWTWDKNLFIPFSIIEEIKIGDKRVVAVVPEWWVKKNSSILGELNLAFG